MIRNISEIMYIGRDMQIKDVSYIFIINFQKLINDIIVNFLQ